MAESLVEGLDETEADEIGSEVLVQLDIMNHQLITCADIPVIRDFLKASRVEEEAAWKVWRAYWDSLDLDQRKAELKNNPFYYT